jgi:hypothetical protein
MPAAALVAVLAAAPATHAGLAAGDTLGPDNWEEARGLLPEEFLAAYQRGDFRHKIVDHSFDLIGEDPVFNEALTANENRYDLSPEGSIIDKETGTRPEYVYAWPFPHIDKSDPKAAAKIVWNYFCSV